MAKILGLDLGVTSIGWALIEEENDKKEILGMGSRIIPLSTDDKDEFSSGNKISKNQKRTSQRTQRKGYDRYQLRRTTLTKVLQEKGLFDETLFGLKPLELWGLRAKAVNEKIELKELGRVLYHLNQKRGYKSSRSDANLDKKDTEYVAEVKSRHQEIKEEGITIGQKFFIELQKDQYYRIKQQVFPREAYIEEFEAICKEQQKHYPQIITNEFIIQLRDEIIYYQRKLKSQKGLVSVCEFEGFWTKNKDGKEIFAGAKVAPKSSPLFQVCKIWESINTITLKNKKGEIFEIPLPKKQELFEYLDNNEKLSSTELFRILDLKKNDGWYSNKQIERGIQGNITKTQIIKVLEKTAKDTDLLMFDLTTTTSEKEVFLIDRKTGEVIGSKQHKIIDADIEQQPLYKLWHTIYSIADVEECTNALIKKFNHDKETAEKLANIDFTKYAFGNKSAKAMRKVLPYLMEGNVYSDACSYAGYNHSNSLTKDENLKRELATQIKLLEKNSLRQPVVEKILNQMINVVNAIIEKHGKPDEIRVELARELKQSKDERNNASISQDANKKINEEVAKKLSDLGIRSTKRTIEKYKMIYPIRQVIKKDGKVDSPQLKSAKIHNQCIYCGESFNISEALTGNNFDVDHIIPKSLLFDDSQTNKVLVHRKCNADDKKNKTAYDFIRAKGEEELSSYLSRLDDWFERGILSYSKYERLKVSNEDYLQRKAKKKETETDKKLWESFIDRQLRQTQYIARKSKEILEQVCTNVWSTSGTVTEYLRRIWGWDDVLMNLQLSKYRELGLTEWTEWETNKGEQKHKKEVIKDWSKRDDHRHHAIDALVIACTKQGFIQRINNLSSEGNRKEMYDEVGKTQRGSLLENYLVAQKPFTTREVEEKAAEILISFKAGKKVATFGKRKVKKGGKKEVVQSGIIVPRGALSEESVYGKIKTLDKQKPPKYLFENSDLIIKGYIKDLVKERLAQHENDTKKAIASLKKEPIYLNAEKTKLLEYATCYKEEVVIKYPLESIKAKDTEYIIDEKIKALVKTRLAEHNDKEKEAFKTPLYLNEEKGIKIKTVRMFTGLSSVEPVKKDESGNDIGFVKPGNNHHIAFYIDENGKKTEHGCTFWHAVERKKYELPVIIKTPQEVWNKIDLSELPQDFLNKLPKHNWTFVESLQQNEMFVLGLSKEAVDEAIHNDDRKLLNQYLYRVQKMSIKGNGALDMTFRGHLETQINDSNDAKTSKRFYNIQSIGAFERLNPVKVRVSNLGAISKM